jgi:hypothetical protein
MDKHESTQYSVCQCMGKCESTQDDVHQSMDKVGAHNTMHCKGTRLRRSLRLEVGI